MGTRSLTRIIPRQEGLSYSDGHTRGELALVNAYQQYDGYPESMAVQYAEWLEGISVGNGLSGEPRLSLYANTVGHDTYMSIYHVPSRSVIFVGKPAKALEQYKTNTK